MCAVGGAVVGLGTGINVAAHQQPNKKLDEAIVAKAKETAITTLDYIFRQSRPS